MRYFQHWKKYDKAIRKIYIYYNYHATLIQKVYRGYHKRKKYKQQKILEEAESYYLAQSTRRKLRKLNQRKYVTPHDFATRIQKCYRGYKVRLYYIPLLQKYIRFIIQVIVGIGSLVDKDIINDLMYMSIEDKLSINIALYYSYQPPKSLISLQFYRIFFQLKRIYDKRQVEIKVYTNILIIIVVFK